MIKVQTNRISMFGIITIFFWGSHLFYVLPGLITPEIVAKRIISEARASVGVPPESLYMASKDNSSQLQLDTAMANEVQQDAAAYLVPIILGMLSGILLLFRSKWGQRLAIILCAWMIFCRVLSWARHPDLILPSLKFVFISLLPQRPIEVIHKDIILPLIFIGTIIFLTRPSVKAQIK